MIEIALRRGFSEVVASPRVTTGEQGKIDRGWRDKSADVRRADCGWESWAFAAHTKSPAVAFPRNAKQFNMRCAVSCFDTASSSS
jgi:hypothetical protein